MKQPEYPEFSETMRAVMSELLGMVDMLVESKNDAMQELVIIFLARLRKLYRGEGKLFDYAIEEIEDAVLMVEEGQPEYLEQAVNTALRRILETTRDLTGKTPLEIFRRPELENAVHEILRSGPAHVVEIPAAGNRILQANVAPVPGGSGGIESVVVVFHDLTDIRRMERMRRDFVANVSHEFKTPLTSIRGYAETLMSGAKDDPQIAFDFLRTIERNAQHLEILVSDLLTLARLEAEVPSTKEQIELRPLIEEQIASRMNPLQDRGVHVSIDCPDIEVHADRARLSAALSNLLDNAIYYNKPGGQISISAEVQDRTLRLAVADSGQGIPSEELPRIFERFYRVDKARARDSGGTGLGLSIVKHAIESQGGTINVTSRLGAGSTFTIRLPI